MKVKGILFILLQTILITGTVIFAVIPFSCKVTMEGIEIIGGDYTAPYLNEIKIVDEETLEISFSECIHITNLVVSPRINGISDSDVCSVNEMLSPSLGAAVGQYGKIETSIEYINEETAVIIHLSTPTEIGKDYEVFGVVEDRIGNSLTFTSSFAGFNSSIPKMIMTEVQIKYGKGSSGGNAIYRGEYVELMALEAGNLIGLEIISASDGDSKKYQFPNVEVEKGEIILVHLRTAGEGCVNETDDLDAATAPHSKSQVRDLWDENTTAHFNDSSDVIILRNRVDGSIMDGVMYASIDSTEWKKGVADYALEMQSNGIYPSWDIANASSSKGCTTLRSLTRQNSLEIYEMVMNDEDFEYPFPADEETWQVEPVSPGTI